MDLMINEKKVFSKFYYPYCPYCYNSFNDRVVDIYFNDDFTINLECKNDVNHIKEKIYFDTFERFFLKEKEFNICYKCNTNVETESKYICKECKKIYCNLCLFMMSILKQILKICKLKIINALSIKIV